MMALIPSLNLEASGRNREEFDNGRHNGPAPFMENPIDVPEQARQKPAPSALSLHNGNRCPG